jgi:nicotinate phosphoribosyltransferase
MEKDPKLNAAQDSVLDLLLDLVKAAGHLAAQTDKYFTNTSKIVGAHGDATVTFAVFMRRRVVAALEPAIKLARALVPGVEIKRYATEGEVVPSERKLMEITGSMKRLSEVETILLQKIGFPCVCANNAYDMCKAVPYANFMDMHARHASGAEMNILAAYGAMVGSESARRDVKGAKGFIGSSQDLTAPFFGASAGMGTMPHALVGYADGDVLKAMKLFAQTLPDAKSLIALVDYTGQEISDSLRCAEWFYSDAKLDREGKQFGVRLDTHGGRFAEGLDYEKSVDVVGQWLDVSGEYSIVESVLGGRAFQLDPSNILVDKVRRILFGKGVSVANIIHTRKSLDRAGFKQALIVGSSGFDPQKCQIMGGSKAPLDMIGTGSFLPATLTETYATADIIRYNLIQLPWVGTKLLLSTCERVCVMFCKSLCFALFSSLMVFSAPVAVANNPAVKIHIDLSSQTMSVRQGGSTVANWRVSTGKSGSRTPTGSWRINRMAHNHFSSQFKVKLPYAMFFVNGIAIHATTKQTHLLGKPVSNGCVRLSPENAARLYRMVGRHGARNTRVTVTY